MYLVYPAIFYKDKESEKYVVYFSDFNGATEGENLTHAYIMASDYIGSWLYEYYIEQKEYPKQSDILKIEIEKDEYSDLEKSFKTLVGIDMDKYVKDNSKKTVKKNLTIPSYLNEMGNAKKLNFSKILQDALKAELEIN